MGLRFGRSLKLIPGVKFNLSKSGVSTSIGASGAWLNFGKRGTRATVGLPGTGLSYVSQLSGAKPTAEEHTGGLVDATAWLIKEQAEAIEKPNSAWPGLLAVVVCFCIGAYIMHCILR